jgi:ABC-2 type transport system ATP-binding protein
MPLTIEVKNVVKRYQTKQRTRRWPFGRVVKRNVEALRGVSLSVSAGEFYSLVGPNGAGKTTLIKVLCTLLEHDGGNASVCGFDTLRQSDSVRKRIGVCLQSDRSVYWKLTGRENLNYFAAISGLYGKERRESVDAALELVNLTERADDYVEQYSTGMRQRLALACSLVNAPQVLLLDEPTVGLDVQAARDIRAFLREELCSRQGKTIFYTTHYLSEAEELSDRVGILNDGLLVAEGSPAELIRKAGGTITVNAQVIRPAADLTDRLKRVPKVVGVLASQPGSDGLVDVSVRVHGTETSVPPVASLLMGASDVRSLTVKGSTLEDAFIALTGRKIKADGEAVGEGSTE